MPRQLSNKEINEIANEGLKALGVKEYFVILCDEEYILAEFNTLDDAIDACVDIPFFYTPTKIAKMNGNDEVYETNGTEIVKNEKFSWEVINELLGD